MMTTLLGKGLMSCAGIFFARTGHTHGCLGHLIAFSRLKAWFTFQKMRDDIPHNGDVHSWTGLYNWDQLFGLLAACVRYVDLICDVPDLIASLILCFPSLWKHVWWTIDWLNLTKQQYFTQPQSLTVPSKENPYDFGPHPDQKVDWGKGTNQCPVHNVLSALENMVSWFECCNLKIMCKHHDQQYCPAPNLFFLPCLRPFIARPGCSRSSRSPSKAEWSGTQMGTMPLSSWEEQACYWN